MRTNALVFAALACAGCASADPDSCAFAPAADGWVQVLPDATKPFDARSGETWFKNAQGDYLICANPRSDSVCGGMYALYERRQDGTYGEFDGVCTR